MELDLMQLVANLYFFQKLKLKLPQYNKFIN